MCRVGNIALIVCLLCSISACSILEGLAVTSSEFDTTPEQDSSSDGDTASDSDVTTDEIEYETDTDSAVPAETDPPTVDTESDETSDSEDSDTVDPGAPDTETDTLETDTEDTEAVDTATEWVDSDTFDSDTFDSDTFDSETFETDTPVDTDTELAPPTAVPIPFNPDDIFAYVAPDRNPIGLRGWWKAYPSFDQSSPPPGYSHISMDASVPNIICAEGQVYDDPSGNYELNFGAKVGFETCTVGGNPSFYMRTEYSLSACPANPTNGPLSQILVGFSFTLRGRLPTHELRVQFEEQNRLDGTYVRVTEPGDYEIFFEDATLEYDPEAPPISVPNIIDMMFFIPASGGPSAFNFCIENLHALVRYPGN